MTKIDIYDIAGDKWYGQPTEAGPRALTRGCAVAVPAKDYSSFNIYYYGGYNGTDGKSDFSDDVWILSLPSFVWRKIKSGTPGHGRAGHKCVLPYPDQMMIIGGYTPQPGTQLSCLDSIVQLFNLTSGKWLDSYDPDVHNDYGVPEIIHQTIGGGYAGGATVKTPLPSGWATPSLASVFATPYATTKLTTWYPYGSATPTNRPDLVPAPSGGGGLPSWVAPVLGVVLGLGFITSLAVCFFLWRRRKVLRNATNSEAGTEENGYRILSWIRGQQSQADTKAPTVSTEDTPMSPQDMSQIHSPVPPTPRIIHHEMADTHIAELPGELHSLS
jgi:hypothetical protein